MRHVVLKHALSAQPRADDFQILETPPPACPDGGVRARVLYVSLDPYVGSRLRGRHMGEAPPAPMREPIPGACVAQVVETRTPDFAIGDVVHTMEGAWADEIAIAAGHARKLDPAMAPLQAHLSTLGMPGLTAWAGVTQLARVNAGDIVLVDAAAGAVGGAVGQIAKIKGARAIGVAGGSEKVRLVVNDYGFDACVDYKAPNWEKALDAALPAPPTLCFENVSVAMLTTMLSRAAPYARVVLCGLVDQYHADAPPPQIPAGLIIGKRAQVLGLVVYDFYRRWSDFLAEAAPWVREGRLRIAEDVAHGLNGAPALFEKLMQGRNIGKCIVAVAEPS